MGVAQSAASPVQGKQEAKSKGEWRFLQGNEACALAAIAAGCRFFAGYPISPSSEIAEYLSSLLPRHGGRFIQMEDEIAAMGAVIGASLGGLKSLTATSGPGVSLKQENLGYACMAEVPCVIVNVMRGGPSTGAPTSPGQSDIQQARWGTHGDHPVIALTPGSVGEIYRKTVRAFNLAERFRTPVQLLLDEINGHMREKVWVPDPTELEIVERNAPPPVAENYLPYAVDNRLIPQLAPFGTGYRYHVTGLDHGEDGFPTNDPKIRAKLHQRLMDKVGKFAAELEDYETVEAEDAEILLVSFGSTARSALGALRSARQRGLKVGLFRPITLWPFPEATFRKIAVRAKRIIVAEMNLGQLILEIQRLATSQQEVLGVQRSDGEPINPSQILERL